MIGGDIVNQFRELGYPVKLLSRNILFGEPGTKEYGEVDLFLQNGDTAILIEVKTNLSVDDVKEHVDRMEKFRRFINEGHGDSAIKYYIGALAAAVVKPNIAAFAQKQGFYVIVQSGEAVEILPSPDGFVAKKW